MAAQTKMAKKADAAIKSARAARAKAKSAPMAVASMAPIPIYGGAAAGGALDGMGIAPLVSGFNNSTLVAAALGVWGMTSEDPNPLLAAFGMTAHIARDYAGTFFTPGS